MQPEDPTRRLPDPTRRLPARPAGGPGPAAGAVLGGRYRLGGLLGSGGMADVFRAEDERLGREVAVKVFRPGADPDGEQLFEQETRTLARLRHPGLVALHDAGVERGRAYLVMELVDGPTLAQELTRQPYDAAAATQVGLELARALAYVHEEGVVHRDVKPTNVLVEADGRVRLADFGVSRLAGGTGTTAVDATIGTASYLAPEQVRGEPAGPPADVYALGLLLLECLSGRPEYPGDGWAVAEERLERAPRVPPGLPEPLGRTLRAMTSADPARRPTARAVAAALSHGPVEPEPGPAGGTLRTVLIAAGVVALLVIGVLAFTGARDDPATDPAAQPVTTTEEAPTIDPEPTPDPEPTTAPAPEPTDDPTTDPGDGGDGGDGGVTLPTGLPDLPDLPTGLPTDLPDLPTDLPTDLPDLPTELPDLPEVPEDARNAWEQFTDWLGSLFR